MLPVHFLKWCRPAKKLSQTTVVTLLSHFWQAGLWCGSGSAFIAKLKNNNNKNARKFITNNYFVNLYQLDVFFYFWAIFCVFWNCWESTAASLRNDTAVFVEPEPHWESSWIWIRKKWIRIHSPWHWQPNPRSKKKQSCRRFCFSCILYKP